MGIFLTAAYRVLKAKGFPLSAKELTQNAIEENLIQSKGLTPHQTMKSKISTDILKNKQSSLFKRTGSGKFGLREWKSEPEFTAPRHVKAIFDEDILVFDVKHLRQFVSADGFTPGNKPIEDVIQALAPIIFTTRRRVAETNQQLIQLISVFIIRYNNLILTHKRTKRLPETRLHDFYSIIFGGHLTKDDFMPLLGHIDFHREISEELRLKTNPEIKYRGFIYDSQKEVSKIHLGLVFDVNLPSSDYEIGERGYLTDPKFESINSIVDRIDDFENWSQILVYSELTS